MNQPDHASETDTQVETPQRKFGYWTGHFVVVASMVGSGILTTSGFTLHDTGNPLALLGLWILGGIMALAGALTIAEMATALPRSGGVYVFVREGFGPGTGFVAGWATFVLGFAAPTAVVSHLAITYLLSPFSDRLQAALPPWALPGVVPFGATVFIALITLSHCFGHRTSAGFQIGVTTVKVLFLLGFAVACLLFGRGDWRHLEAGGWPKEGQWPALAVGLIYVGYAYFGWDGAAYIAGEIRDPARLLPRCLIGGTLTVVALYLLVNLAYIFVLDPAEMQTLSFSEVEKIAELAAARAFGQSVANVLAVLIGLSLVASVSAYILTGPRVIYAMAHDGLFPEFAGQLHGSHGVPVRATITQGALAAVMVWSGSFLDLLDYTSVGLAAVSALVLASAFPLRRRRDLTRTYSMPFYPLPPLLYLSLLGWTITFHLLWSERRVASLLSLLTVLLGIPLAHLFAPERRAKANTPKAG